MTGEAPDFAAPIQAWRVWRVVVEDGRYRLGSVVKETVWPPGRALVAECLRTSLLRRLRRRRPHDEVEPDCTCGIYAARLEDVAPYLAESPAQWGLGGVVGQVSLWGTVVECERGFRASHAYPARIYVPADVCGRGGGSWSEVVSGLEEYGVPIEMLATQRKHAARFLAGRIGT